jgi:hypothetical protein
MRKLPTATWVGLAIAALAAGCGGNSDALERQIAGMRSELVKMRAEQAVLTDRLAAIERSGRSPQPRAAGRPSPAGPDRPALEVVRLEPGAAPPDRPELMVQAVAPPGAEPQPDDEGARPLLRSTPDGGVIAVTDPDPRGAPTTPQRTKRP